MSSANLYSASSEGTDDLHLLVLIIFSCGNNEK